tara:strand:- start:686 stop:1219 length:534 start_codon:yes stop_codon:yes gene_type:complete
MRHDFEDHLYETQKELEMENDEKIMHGFEDFLYETEKELKMDRKEAIDNLRVAVKASLLTVNHRIYRDWAYKYLEQTEPLNEGLAEIKDSATDRIEFLAGFQPWSSPGRARNCWYIVQHIVHAVEYFHKESYQNCCNEALSAAHLCVSVTDKTRKLVHTFTRQIEASCYGETFTPKG